MYFEDVELNQEYKLGEAVIEKKKMLDFAQTYNPGALHTDEEAAKRSRFGRLIAPGNLSYLVMWEKWVKQNPYRENIITGIDCNMEFLRPVFVDDVLHGVWSVTEKKVKNDHSGIITVQMKVFNQDDILVLDSKSSILLKRKQDI